MSQTFSSYLKTNAIEAKPRVAEDFEYTQVSQSARASARQDDPEGSSRQPSGAHLQRGNCLRLLADDLDLAGLQLVESCVRDRRSENEQLTSVKGAGLCQPACLRDAGGDGEHEVGLANAQLGPAVGGIAARTHDDAVCVPLGLIDCRQISSVQTRHRTLLRECRRQAAGDLVDRRAFVEPDDRDRFGRRRGDDGGAAGGELSPHRPCESEGETRRLLDECFEGLASQFQQLGIVASAHGSRSRALAQQSEFPEDISAPENPDERLRRPLVEDLHPPTAHDEHAVGRLSFAHDPAVPAHPSLGDLPSEALEKSL